MCLKQKQQPFLRGSLRSSNSLRLPSRYHGGFPREISSIGLTTLNLDRPSQLFSIVPGNEKQLFSSSEISRGQSSNFKGMVSLSLSLSFLAKRAWSFVRIVDKEITVGVESRMNVWVQSRARVM